MSRKTKRNTSVPEIALAVFSNHPKSSDYDLLEMYYTGAFANQLGLMEALHKESGETHRLIVGTEWNEGKQALDVYPLARILDPSELQGYLSPDGKGNYE